MRPIATLLLLPLLALAAHAGEEADPGRLLETLVRQTLRGPDVGDPSPTSLVADLLRADPARLSGALRETWDSRHLLDWDAARALEEVVQLLHGLAPDGTRAFGPRPPAGGLWEYEGVVLVRTVAGGERWNGPFEGADLPPFDQHLGSRELRAPPAPAAERLWAACEAGAPDAWGEAERISFVLALGEAARADPEIRGKLLAASRAAPKSRLLAIALGSLGGPEAAALLAERLRAAVPRKDGYSEDFRELGRCLQRADPDGPRAALRTLEGPLRKRVAECIGRELVLPSVLREFEATADPAARRPLLAEMDDLVRESYGYGPKQDLAHWLAVLLRALDTARGAERETVLHVAGQIVGVPEAYPISGSFASDEGSSSETGESVGPPAGPEAVLRMLAEDLAAGRLVPLDATADAGRDARALLLSPPPEPVKADGSRAHADIPCPMPNMSKPDPDFPVHAAAKWVDAGLELTIRNTGPATFLVNPVALRYGPASASTVTVRRTGEERKTTRQLKLELGWIPGSFAVPAAELRAVEPGGTWSWVLPVRPEFRDAQHIVISLRSAPILGRPPQPVLLTMNDTWIR